MIDASDEPGRIALKRLSHDPVMRSALVTLAMATTTDMGPEDLNLIGGVLVADGMMERVTFRYLAAVQDLTPVAMETSLRRTQPERWEVLVGTMAETWMEEGLTRGPAQGKAELLLRQMERWFGKVPETVRTRITGASIDEFDAWGDVLLEAANLENVMVSKPRHSIA